MGLKKWLRSWLGVDEAVAEGMLTLRTVLQEMDDEAGALKARVNCQENRLTDLGAYSVAAVKEMRKHAQHRQAPAEDKFDHSKCCG